MLRASTCLTKGGCIINISTLTLIALHVLDVLLCGPTRGSSRSSASILQILRNRTAAPVPCALLIACAAPVPAPSISTQPSLHPPHPFGLFYAEGAALATKRSHRSGSDWSRAGFDVISVCLLVVPPALVVALCPLPLWHYFNNEATVRPRSHSSLAPCPLKVLFFFCCCFCSRTKHAEWHEPQLRLPRSLPLYRLPHPLG